MLHIFTSFSSSSLTLYLLLFVSQILLLFGTLLFLSMVTALANIVWSRNEGRGIWYEDVQG